MVRRPSSWFCRRPIQRTKSKTSSIIRVAMRQSRSRRGDILRRFTRTKFASGSSSRSSIADSHGVRRPGMKILFVLDKRVDAGSIHAVANYVQAADEAGYVVALYGHPDSRYPAMRFSADPAAFDFVVFIAETG